MTRMLRLWGRLPRLLVDMGQYHSIWGPGVLLLRNLGLRHKTWIVSAAVAVPMVYLAVQIGELRIERWRDTAEAVNQVQLVHAVHRQQTAAFELGHALALGEAGDGGQRVARARETEQRGLQALDARLQETLAERPELGAALGDVVSARAAWLTKVAAPVATQAPVQPASAETPAASTTPEEGFEAVAAAAVPPPRSAPAEPAAAGTTSPRAYIERLSDLRRQFDLRYSPLPRIDRQAAVLADGLVAPAATLTPHLYALRTLIDEATGTTLDEPMHDALQARLYDARSQFSLAGPLFNEARASLLDRSAALDDDVEAIRALFAGVEELLRRDEPNAGVAPIAIAAERAIAANLRIGEVGLSALDLRLGARHDAVQSVLRGEALLVGLGFLLSLYLLVCAYKVVAGGLRFLCLQVDELGRGNLSIRPVGHGRDEIGHSLTVLGQAAGRMSALLEAVSHGVSAVSHASRVVATGNAGLSDRSTEIRQSISLAAGTTETFASAMDQCADAVERAAEHVRSMRRESQRGRRAMGGLQTQMHELQSRSHEIEQVVNLIETIAYQTKLLAINASVEAARAGPAGKGFSVVSQEVRSLATRSETATRRIQDIVRASVSGIQDSTLETERVGQAMERAAQEVDQIEGAVGEIVTLARESRSRAREVLTVAHEVDEAVSGNARLVQQLSEASAELRDQGNNLKRSVGHFELG